MMSSENGNWRSTALGAVVIRVVSVVLVLAVIAFASGSFWIHQPGVRDFDPDGVLVLSIVGAIVAIGASAARPAWRRTASISVAWSCGATAWVTALLISTDGGSREDLVWSVLVLGGTYIGVPESVKGFESRGC